MGGKTSFVLLEWDPLRLGGLCHIHVKVSLQKLGGFRLLVVGVGGSCLKVYWAGNGGLPQGFNLSQACQSIIFRLMPSSVITLRVITQLSPGCKTIQISQRKHPGISMVSLCCHNFMSVGYKQIIYVLIWLFSCLARSVTSLGRLKSQLPVIIS